MQVITFSIQWKNVIKCITLLFVTSFFSSHPPCQHTKCNIFCGSFQGERGLEGPRGARGQQGIGIKGDKVERRGYG